MSRAEILEDTIARLERERYTPQPRSQKPPRCDPPPQLTAEQQAENRRLLAEAIGDDADVIDLSDRTA